jgi:predicted DNA-binding transcriptional regulator YafY
LQAKPAGISEKVIRLLDIYTLIAHQQFPSVSSLMERFRVSKRSVFRYLEIIGLIDPIEFDHERNGYKFTHGDRIKKLTLNDSELLVLLAAGEAVAHLGEPLADNFKRLAEKVAVTTKAPGKKEKPPIIVKIPEAIASQKLKGYFNVLSTCATERRCVEMTYLARNAPKPSKRMVDPYGLVYYDGVWILIGYCHVKKAIRSFALDRIIDVTERFRYFNLPEDFDLEEYLSPSWGIYDDEEVTVKVRFRPNVCDYIMRKVWHPSEQKESLPDGGCVCTYTVAGTDEIKKWIYSWLPHVEVLEPSWFRKQVEKELSMSVKMHNGEG